MLGVRLVRLLSRPEPAAIEAPAEDRASFPVLAVQPQVSLTVVHVAAGALVNFGSIDPRLFPAVPQQRAVTATPITEGEQE
jgi:hypothetical protein